MRLGRRARLAWAAAGLAGLLALAALWPYPAATLHGNLGWLALSRAVAGPPDAQARWASRAVAQCSAAVAEAPGWGRARFAQGLALAYSGRPEEALATWRLAPVGAAQLLDLGRKEAEAGHDALALLLWRGAALAPGAEAAEGEVLAQTVCQQHALDAAALGAAGLAYCDAWRAAQGGSVVVNGGFDAHVLGWRVGGVDAPEQALALDPAEGAPAPSARLRSAQPGGRVSLMQTVPVPAGGVVELRARVRAELAPSAQARLLVVEPVDAPVAPKEAGTVEGVAPWREVTLRYPVPRRVHSLRIYPAIVRGQGAVWIDDVRVTLRTP